jgi:hypothetical protein
MENNLGVFRSVESYFFFAFAYVAVAVVVPVLRVAVVGAEAVDIDGGCAMGALHLPHNSHIYCPFPLTTQLLHLFSLSTYGTIALLLSLAN